MTTDLDFRDGLDWLRTRCEQRKVAPSAVAEQLGWPRNYMTGLFQHRYKPSRPRADKLARFFGDDPNAVRLLWGLPIGDKETNSLFLAISSLPKKHLPSLRNFLKNLKD